MLNKVFIAIAAVLLAFLSAVPTSAKIVAISAPKHTLHPGDHFDVTFQTEDWIINVDEYYVIFGIEPQPAKFGGLEELLGTGYDIVAHGHSVTGHGHYNVPLRIPKTIKPSHKTEYLLTAAVFITAGAVNGASINEYTTNITISR